MLLYKMRLLFNIITIKLLEEFIIQKEIILLIMLLNKCMKKDYITNQLKIL